MRRVTATRLELTGREIDALIIGVTPYDPRRLPPKVFAPAERHVAMLGHLLRRYHAPEAWIREAAFRVVWGSLAVHGPTDELDELEHIVTVNREQVAESFGPYIFEYRDLDPLGLPTYDPERLAFISARDVAELIAHDRAHDRLVESHEIEIERGLAAFLGQYVSAHLFLDPSWTFEDQGLRYDLGGKHRQRPSHLEETARSRGLSVLRPRRGGHDEPLGLQPGELSRADLGYWLDERLATGSLALRDFGADGVVWPLLVMARDGRAVGARRVSESSWRLSAPMTLSSHSRRFAQKSTERHIRSSLELP